MANFKYLLLILSIIAVGVKFVAALDNDNVINIVADDFVDDFQKEFQAFEQSSGKKSTKLQSLLEILDSDSFKISVDEFPESPSPKTCLRCRAFTSAFLNEFRENGKNNLEKVAIDLCGFTSLQDYVCDGFVNLNSKFILYFLENKPFNSKDICRIAFQHEKCGSYPIENSSKLKISEKPVDLHKTNSKSSNSNPLKILQLTDIHYDPEYMVGVNADCQVESCCRNLPNLSPSNPRNAAGKWGDYHNCDTPLHSITDALQHIKTEHENIDIIYFTGDIIHHFTWNTSLKGNEDDMQTIFDLLKNTFEDTLVFPILGNHESHPANLYAPNYVPKELSTDYLYDFVCRQWEIWLPENARETLHKGGYYTVTPWKGFRIIALNSNVCFVHNWWLLFDTDYFVGQLQWLHDNLLEAEKTGDMVHILTHVPANDNYCYYGWTREYRKIVERFSHIISAQFNGHSHVDEFNVFFEKTNLKNALNVAWNGGSLTTFPDFNPNYKIYQVNRENYQVLDFETWIYNLTEANMHPNRNPNWFKLYSFKEYFNLDNLSLTSLNELINSFSESNENLMKYWKIKQKVSDPVLHRDCDENCLHKALCEITRTEFDNDEKCHKFLN